MLFNFAGFRRRFAGSSSTSNSSKISTKYLQLIIDKLLGQSQRSSTARNYLAVWRQFNKFVISLDVKPQAWEDRVTLLIAHKIDQGMKSTTVKSYVSAIKKLLVDDGYPWDDQKVLLGSLTKACRIINDKVYTRLPIQCSLLEMILFELNRIFGQKGQLYLETMYRALFALSYYGLMRISEVTISEHVVKAKDAHFALNKDKLLLMLYSSKIHDTGMKPQKIKITSNLTEKSGFYARRNFCPFDLVNNYMSLRGDFESAQEQFFVFKDKTPVSPFNARNTLKNCLTNLGLDHSMYGFHSLRIGRTTDLIKYNYSIEEVKRMGRWRSNVVYRYIKP